MEEYARSLLERGWTETVEEDLERMNGGKLGRPFVFTGKMIEWGNRLKHALGISYRLARGFLNHFLREKGLRGISLTQFYDRCRDVSAVGGADGRVLASGPCDVEVSEAPISVAIDSTGMSLNKYGGWMSYHWNMKPVTGWIKLHAAVDPDTNRILAYAVTDERCGDIACFDGLMDDVFSAGHRVGKVLADAAYDSKAIWNEYTARGIDVAINIRNSQLNKNVPDYPCRIRSHGCMPRGREMARILKIGRDEWKREKGYNRRWKVECTFSDDKRLFGDTLSSRKLETDVEETVMKVLLLNEYKQIRMGCQRSE
jgi:transposase